MTSPCKRGERGGCTQAQGRGGRVISVEEGRMGDSDIRFSIERRIGVLSEGSRGWKKELNLVSWNEREAKLDLRD